MGNGKAVLKHAHSKRFAPFNTVVPAPLGRRAGRFVGLG
jgi:hypothetical protein